MLSWAIPEFKWVNIVKELKLMSTNERTGISGSSTECIFIFTWPVCYIPDHILEVLTEIDNISIEIKKKDKNNLVFLPQILAKIKWL
jgi:hypothetical protein